MPLPEQPVAEQPHKVEEENKENTPANEKTGNYYKDTKQYKLVNETTTLPPPETVSNEEENSDLNATDEDSLAELQEAKLKLMLGILLMTLFLFVILLAICSAVLYKMKTMKHFGTLQHTEFYYPVKGKFILQIKKGELGPGGRCQRLCCHFRHREMRWELSEAARCSSLEVLGVQRSHVESMGEKRLVGRMSGTTTEELERINKEIESVKAEVAEKRKRLSRFTLALEELSQSPVASLSDTNVRQGFPENSLLPKEQWNEPSKSKESQPRKYVMDHRCPATDLEYDPLLNYSAGLLGASKAKQGETDRQHFWKKSVGGNCHKSLESQRPYVSPIRIKINLQDSDEDDLVMDVPPIIPTSKKSKPFRGL
ncbi:hypothetical protein J1605_020892 [Eschrichtius robustus]|uniref:Uncharacterized protein n=1 Tax=Eschrichtius robustus TaxID=9764 RepID=A0AB34HJB8_ESCRO|nr:hypothetical protein J1605_020892 [Eschrichtius robustus]